MIDAIRNLKVAPVRYSAPSGEYSQPGHYQTSPHVSCVGTNVTWETADGTKHSSRLPWVESLSGARARIERMMK